MQDPCWVSGMATASEKVRKPMKSNKQTLEEVCCVIAATLFLSPAVWVLARELMGY